MGNKRETRTDRQAWRRLKEIGGLVGGVLLVTARRCHDGQTIPNRVAALLACFLLGLTLVIVQRVPGTKGFVVLLRRWAEPSKVLRA